MKQQWNLSWKGARLTSFLLIPFIFFLSSQRFCRYHSFSTHAEAQTLQRSFPIGEEIPELAYDKDTKKENKVANNGMKS